MLVSSRNLTYISFSPKLPGFLLRPDYLFERKMMKKAPTGIRRRRGAKPTSTRIPNPLLIGVGFLIVSVLVFSGVAYVSMGGVDNNSRGQLLRHPGPLLRAGSLKEKLEPTHQLVNENNNKKPPYPYPLEVVPADYNISASFVVRGGGRYTEYVSGKSPYAVASVQKQSDEVARSRRYHVKKAMELAWGEYVKYAFGLDEIQPVSGRGTNGWGGQGITLVDSLDTLWLMGMKDEFNKARDWVRDHLDHSKTGQVSVFETTIRDLGGLLSAFDWSGDEVFRTKAIDLGERLFHCFDGAQTGIPFGQVNLGTGATNNVGWTGNSAILAEFGSIQVEFRYLARISGNKEFATKTERVFEIMKEIAPKDGLYPYFYRNEGRLAGEKPRPTNDKITFGAMADSFYEYMLKLWLQGGKTEPMYREMYDKAMDGMHEHLLQTSTPSNLVFIADRNNGVLDTKMDHLVCFMGGLLALGAYTDPNGLDSPRAQRDVKTAKALTYTCYQMYARMNTGIAPEFVQFQRNSDFTTGHGYVQ
jgi:Glycosyl hydrolase family 47